MLETAIYLLICLAPAILVSAVHSALRSLGRLQGAPFLEKRTLFPLFPLLKSRKHPALFFDFALFSLLATKALYYLIFGFVSFYFLFVFETAEHVEQLRTFSFYSSSLLDIAFVFGVALSIDILCSIFAEKMAKKIIHLLAAPASVLMLPCFPLIYLHAKIKTFLLPTQKVTEKLPFKLKDKLEEYISQSELGWYLEKAEVHLMHTVISFKERIVREVMVPRINIFSLPITTPIGKAASFFIAEGYSRIPIYEENVDKIVGILLHKDLLAFYASAYEKEEHTKELLSQSVAHLVKPALYAPETKKIAQLLQEFRVKQTHLAIVVDEYGGTEGIVTIEDILEELVGEIEDEYDVYEGKVLSTLACGGWIVDAKMSIIDLEEDLGVKIPQSGEYDTIGGFIFHKTGSIPGKGWKVHLDTVDLEILSSDERSIHKIKITPRKNL